MDTIEGTLEYEILDIDFGISYELPEDDNAFVREDEPTQTKDQKSSTTGETSKMDSHSTLLALRGCSGEQSSERQAQDKRNSGQAGSPTIEYDEDGIPMGHSKEEAIIRRKFVYDYIQKWRDEHRDNPRVFNEDIQAYIKVTQVFMLESVNHAVGNYKSTKAVLKMEEVLSKAKKIGETNIKEGNSNQKHFEKMLVMHYKSAELGNVKMTVGVRLRTKEKIGYSITVPSPGTAFIDESMKKEIKGNSKKRKKRSK